MCTNQHYSLHTHPLFRHPSPPVIYRILLCFWGRVHESIPFTAHPPFVKAPFDWPIQDIALFLGSCARINTILCAPTLCLGTPRLPSYTRYCFVSGVVCTNQYHSLHTHPLFRHPPPPIIAYTIAKSNASPRPSVKRIPGGVTGIIPEGGRRVNPRLRNRMLPPDPPLLQCIHSCMFIYICTRGLTRLLQLLI